MAISQIGTNSIASAGVAQSNLASGVAGNGPAFSAYTNDNSTYFNNSVATKVKFNVETFDTNSCYDNVTNYRFTPNVAGYYLFTLKILGPSSSGGQLISYIYKNGNNVAETAQVSNAQAATGVMGSYLVYANGTTDYFEAYFYQSVGSSQAVYTGAHQTFFQGVLVRSA